VWIGGSEQFIVAIVAMHTGQRVESGLMVKLPG